MTSALHVDAAGQLALSRRMDSIANNIANAATPGFRADGVRFESVLSETAGRSVAYPAAGQDYITTTPGAMKPSGNPFDIAVRGDGWFALQSPAGPVYTRDGRLEMTATGELRSVTGYPVLDASGASMALDPSAGPIAVAADGMITQGGRQVGAVGLFSFDPSALLTRFDNSSVRSNIPPSPVLDFRMNGVVQGFVEQSNVNPVREMTRMIEVQRAFDAITASADMLDGSKQEAIKILGGGA